MRRVLVGVGVLVILIGAIFTLQGAGILPGSFMTGQTFWLLVGLGMLVVGAIMGAAGLRLGPFRVRL
ncbi:MAG TPA: hypothetical protein VKY74_10825 [Chloroflexia bacterium]|nr:hypothetical protein [Chloroflexia bacterium]